MRDLHHDNSSAVSHEVGIGVPKFRTTVMDKSDFVNCDFKNVDLKVKTHATWSHVFDYSYQWSQHCSIIVCFS